MAKAKTTSETLKETGDLLRERGWTEGYLGIDENGERVVHVSSFDYHLPMPPATRQKLCRAKKFCAVGALKVADGPCEANAALLLAEVMRQGLIFSPDHIPNPQNDYKRIYRFNDDKGEHATLYAIDAAYVLALQEEGLEPEDVL